MRFFWNDLRYAFRVLAKSPVFTAVAIATLALGIGANTAIFSVVNAVLLQPLPFRDPAKLVIIAERSKYPTISVSYQNYLDWRDQSHSFESMEATRATNMNFTGSGEPERVQGRMATAGLFPLLGVQAVAGRTFSPEEDRAGGAPVALVSYGLWQRRFGGARDLIGKSMTLDAKPYTVIGILPPEFQILQPADVFLPLLPWAKTLPDDRNWHPGIIAIARLKEGVTKEQATTEMRGISRRLELQYPLYNSGQTSEVVGLQAQIVKDVRPALILLLSAVSFVLLIACVNVANLLLSRAASRGKEMAIRTAMGAGRARVVRQLLTESLLLGIVGGILGLFLAKSSIGVLLSLAAGTVPNSKAVGIDGWVLAFNFLVSITTVIVFGLVPALRTSQIDLRESLNEGSRGSTSGPGHHRLRAVLVVSEIALSMLLLVGAGLLLRSFERMQQVSPGFQADHILVADLPLSQAAYSKPAQRFQFFERLIERSKTLPGVRSVGAASFLPVSGGGSILHFNISGRPPKSPKEFIAAGYRTVSSHYLETVGIPLLQGRLFSDADNQDSPAVVIINATLAHTFFPNENPLGKRMQIGALPDQSFSAMEIVGVVGDVRPGLGLDPGAEMYLPYRQADAVLPVFQLSVVLRTVADPLSEVSALREALHEIEPSQPLVKVRTMEDNIAATAAQPRFRTLLLSVFAALALILAAVGVYGVMSYSVTQRTNEIGIRMTLGAQSRDVFRIIVGHGLRLALAGIAVGFLAAVALTRVLGSFLYAVSPLDPLTLAAVAVLLGAIGFAASYLPARRATRVDPMVALRYE